jgi:TPR repeat protein
VRYYRLAADAGDADAQTSLGLAYYLGRGVDKDIQQAYIWSALAAQNGMATAKNIAAMIEKELTPEQIAGAQKQIKKKQGK